VANGCPGIVDNFRGMMNPSRLTIYFIDGYNLLHRESGLSALLNTDPAGARTLFLRWLCRQDRLPMEQMRVVLDGGRLPAETVPDGLAVSWAEVPETADSRLLKLISREVRKAQQRIELVLVSDDNDLRQQARFRGVALLACARFRQDFLSSTLPDPADVRGASGRDSQEDRQARSAGTGPDGLRVRKSGTALSAKEVEGWMAAFEQPDTPDEPAREDSSPEGWIGQAPVEPRPKRPAGIRLEAGESDPRSGQAPDKLRRKRPLDAEEAEFARLMGVDSTDPNLYEPDEEEDL
jgi:predicted RNA-binding protein with PIN domain